MKIVISLKYWILIVIKTFFVFYKDETEKKKKIKKKNIRVRVEVEK